MTFFAKELIIFDLDGTLIDSAPDLALTINLMLADLQLEPVDESLIRTWVGNGAQVLVERALAHAYLSKPVELSLIDDALAIFLNHYQHNLVVKSRLYPDVYRTLTTLKQQGFTLALITNKPERFIAPILAAMELNSLFSYVLGGDSLARKKPDPLPLITACQQLDFSVEQAVMVGDSKNDILAAKAANMQSVGLTYGYNYGEPIANSKPDLVLDHFAKLVDHLVRV
ncbi:phosphoglycolate phosphatase [Pseudoalteromonas tunicata]|uniref:phosphoglycolate phosphatase n=1 Tax=Pseudoalteromonas tunicata TaxID=314281 RepID=UPI00273EBF22|nr:phosphoglycolate phosphatase [Pseudoalteromonas tunicata]MDP4985666.1 phosphoglycolate phosphatase [Pseudoalteromonas tunicata]